MSKNWGCTLPFSITRCTTLYLKIPFTDTFSRNVVQRSAVHRNVIHRCVHENVSILYLVVRTTVASNIGSCKVGDKGRYNYEIVRTEHLNNICNIVNLKVGMRSKLWVCLKNLLGVNLSIVQLLVCQRVQICLKIYLAFSKDYVFSLN